MKVIRWAVMGSFAAIITVIIFVKAGGKNSSGKSGGEQAAMIVKAFGQAGSSVASSLEGG